MKTVSKGNLNNLLSDIQKGEVPNSEYNRKSKYNLRGSDYDYVFNVDKSQQRGNIEFLIKNGSAP